MGAPYLAWLGGVGAVVAVAVVLAVVLSVPLLLLSAPESLEARPTVMVRLLPAMPKGRKARAAQLQAHRPTAAPLACSMAIASKLEPSCGFTANFSNLTPKCPPA